MLSPLIWCVTLRPAPCKHPCHCFHSDVTCLFPYLGLCILGRHTEPLRGLQVPGCTRFSASLILPITPWQREESQPWSRRHGNPKSRVGKLPWWRLGVLSPLAHHPFQPHPSPRLRGGLKTGLGVNDHSTPVSWSV